MSEPSPKFPFTLRPGPRLQRRLARRKAMRSSRRSPTPGLVEEACRRADVSRTTSRATQLRPRTAVTRARSRARARRLIAFAAFRTRACVFAPSRERTLLATDVSVPDRVSSKGLRQFLTPEQQRAWLEGETHLPDADERPNPSNSASNMPPASKSCSSGRRRRTCSTSSDPTARPASPSRARPSASTGPSPACPRAPTGRWSASMRAGWSCSPCTRTPGTSAPHHPPSVRFHCRRIARS